MAAAPHISIEDLSIRYRNKGEGVLALDRVSIDIPPNSFVSVVGPSGCGKTTLLKVVSGILKPSSGAVRLDGAALDARTVAGRIGYVFQRPLLLPWRSALDNISLTLEVVHPRSTRKERDAKSGHWLAMTGLAGFEKRLPHELSGGMQQRVSLCRALAFQPPILMMDEPFAALDEITRESLQDQLLEMWNVMESTVIFITHSIGEAVLLSERIVVMTARPGRVLEVIDVPFPRPRDDALRGSKVFTDLVQHIREKLRPKTLQAVAS